MKFHDSQTLSKVSEMHDGNFDFVHSTEHVKIIVVKQDSTPVLTKLIQPTQNRASHTSIVMFLELEEKNERMPDLD